MPDGGAIEYAVAQVIEWAYAAYEVAAAYAVYVEVALVVAASYQSYESAQRARQAYNASLRDRYVMQRTSTGQRALVLGRARVSGPIAFMQSYGTNLSVLAIVVVLAAHECDAIEKVYFNDTPVVLDSLGNVTATVSTERFSVNSSTPLVVFLAAAAQPTTVVATVTYADGDHTLSTSLSSDGLHLTLSGARAGQVGDVKVTYQPQVCQYTPRQSTDRVYQEAATATGNTFTFPLATTAYGAYSFRNQPSSYITGPVSATSVVVVQTLSGKQSALPFTMVTDSFGNASSVTWSGAAIGAAVQVTYQTLDNTSRARVRQFRGVPGQNADGTLVASLPGEWTTAHRGTGLTYLVCEFDYDQSSFSAGLPNVSATVRGAKLYDPRNAATTWTENPALLARGYWTHPLGANQSASLVDDAAIIAAANVCDPSTSWNLDLIVATISRPGPLYTAGYVATKDMKPQDVLTDLCMAMGGRWVINGNLLRVKAGGYTSPVAAIDASWLTSEGSVTLQPLPARQTLFNSVQGVFADSTNDYRVVPYPKVPAAALITSDGRELPLDISYTAVTRTEQAQYLSACAIRYNRAGMTVRLPCNLKAFPLEVFDVVTVTLSRFGFVAQAFEVTDTSFTADGLLTITLKFIDPSIWALDSSYSLASYAPKTNAPAPWAVQVPVLGTPVTGVAQMLLQADGTAVSRIYVPITMTDLSVIMGGYIDVSYIDAADDITSNWSTITLSGDSQGIYIPAVKDGHTYRIKARARNTLFSSTWSATVSILVVGQATAPQNPSGMAYSQGGGRVHLTWTASTDSDYKLTEVRQGASWAAGALVGTATGTSLDWIEPAHGAYTLWFAHQNRTGLYSATPQSLAVTVDSTIDTGWAALAYLYQRGTSAPALPSAAITYTFATAAMTGITNGWSTTPPAGTNPLYVTVASAVGSGAASSIAAASWSGAVVLAQNGADGATGLNTATVYLFQRTSSSSAPSLPSATVTYTFSTSAAAGVNNGWTQSLPTTGGAYRWVTTATAASTGTTDTISAVEWAAASLLAQDGAGAFTMVGSANMAINGPTVTKASGSSNSWDSQVYSLQAYSGGAVATATPASTAYSFMIALNTDPTTDASYSSLDYAIYMEATANLYVFESGASAGQFGTYAAGDVLSVRYDNASVSYAKNGTVFYSHAVAAGKTLFMDTSWSDVGASATLTFAPAGAAGTNGSNGANGANGLNGITATLTSDTYTLPADSTGHVTSYVGATTTMVVLNGNVDDSSNWTFSKVDSTGVSSTITGNAVTDTSLAAANDTGYIDITAARSGYTSITKRYSLTKAKSAIQASNIVQGISSPSVHGVATPSTVTANAGVHLHSDGHLWRRFGGPTSTYSQTATLFDSTGTCSSTYYVQFDLLTSSGTAAISGTGYKYLVNSSTNSPNCAMSVTNGSGAATFVATVYDSTGGNKLGSFNLSLDVDSSG